MFHESVESQTRDEKEKGSTYYGTVSIEHWSTKKSACKEEEDLERADPGNIRWTLVFELVVLVVSLEDADQVVNDLNLLPICG